jgi:hypothetical protein
MFKFISSKTLMVILSLVLVSWLAPAAFAQKQVTLKSGTPVILATTTNLTSKNVVAGNIVDFKVVADVIVDGNVVISAGTIAKGQVSNVSKASVLGQGGELSVGINNINAIDGTLVPLSGAQISASGKDKLGLAIFCGLCTLVGFLIPGSQAELPAGAQTQAVVMSNTSITL